MKALKMDIFMERLYTGEIKIREEYRDQEKNGRYIRYYENGSVNAIGNFKNGKLNGDWTMFYENGKLLGTAYFEDGEIKKSGL